MITVLLEQIIQLLKGWISDFTNYAATVAEKLGLIEADTSDIVDNTANIKNNTFDIKTNTAAVIAPITSIKNNTDSIKTNTDSIASDSSSIANNIGTISSNTGATAAYTEDTATNTLNILQKVTTIASDTTQIRSDNQVLISNTNDLETYLYYMAKGIKRVGYGEGDLIDFDTDLRDNLLKAIVTIPANSTGYESVQITISGKNLLDTDTFIYGAPGHAIDTPDDIVPSTRNICFNRIPSDRDLVVSCHNYDLNKDSLNSMRVIQCVEGIVKWDSANQGIPPDEVKQIQVSAMPNSYIVVECHSRSTVPIIPIPITGWIQVEEGVIGETSTEYMPFVGKHYEVDLGETLTQGGKLDLLTGILTRSDGTTKQLPSLNIPTLEGYNSIYNCCKKEWTSGGYTYFNNHPDYTEVAYNESIANIIDREIGG